VLKNHPAPSRMALSRARERFERGEPTYGEPIYLHGRQKVREERSPVSEFYPSMGC
jgi:hypothetical protein